MSKYEVCKISVTTTQADGSPIYEQSKEFDTARELLNWLSSACRSWSDGRGSHIFQDGEVIANIHVVQWIDGALSIKKLIEYSQVTA